jgi:hypothetical protein
MRKAVFMSLFAAIISTSVTSQVFYLDSNLPPVLQAYAGSDNYVAPGDSVQIGGIPAALYGYGNYTYFWEPSEGLSDQTVANPWAKPGETTTYTLTVSDGHHCVAMDNVTVKAGASGLDIKRDKLEVSVYPNPAGDHVNILVSGHSGKVIIKIFNSLGQGIVREEAVQQEEVLFNYDTRSWVKGIYHLVIQTPDRVESKSIVII